MGADLCSYGNQTPGWANRKCLITSCEGIPGGGGRQRGSHSRHSGTLAGRVLAFSCCDPATGFASIPLSRLEQQWHLRVGGVKHPGPPTPFRPPYRFCCLRTESVPERSCQSVCLEFKLLARLIIPGPQRTQRKQTFPGRKCDTEPAPADVRCLLKFPIVIIKSTLY